MNQMARRQSNNKTIEKSLHIEIQTTDFKHGLSSSTTSCINLTLRPNDTILNCINDYKSNKINKKSNQNSLAPSLKVNSASNESFNTKKGPNNNSSTTSTLFPILNDSSVDQETIAFPQNNGFKAVLNNPVIPVIFCNSF